MKQFNLKEYLRLKEDGKEPKIVTRAGEKARIICTDRENGDNRSVVALVDYETIEGIITVDKDGKYVGDLGSDRDLFFAPTKHEGWVNIYQGFPNLNCTIYDSEQEALAVRGTKCIATAKIEWTE